MANQILAANIILEVKLKRNAASSMFETNKKTCLLIGIYMFLWCNAKCASILFTRLLGCNEDNRSKYKHREEMLVLATECYSSLYSIVEYTMLSKQ